MNLSIFLDGLFKQMVVNFFEENIKRRPQLVCNLREIRCEVVARNKELGLLFIVSVEKTK